MTAWARGARWPRVVLAAVLSTTVYAGTAALGREPMGPPAPGHTAATETPAGELRPLFANPANARRADPTAESTHGAAVSERGGWADVWAMVTPLVAVLAVVLGAAAVVRRAARAGGGGSLGAALGPGGRAPSGLVEVLARYPVARGQLVVLLRVDARVLVLSHTLPSRGHAGGMATLSEIVEPEQVASILIKARDAEGESTASRFEAVMAEMERRGGADVGAGAGGHEAGGVGGGSRRVTRGSGGDRAEVWEVEPVRGATARGVGTGRERPDPVAALRARLSRLSGAEGGGA
jgi:flagellar biogenesis protein FliO